MNEVQLTGVVWEVHKARRGFSDRPSQHGVNFLLRWADDQGHQEVECEAWGDAAKEIRHQGDGAQVTLSCRPRGGKDLSTRSRGHWSIFTVTGVLAETRVDPVPEQV